MCMARTVTIITFSKKRWVDDDYFTATIISAAIISPAFAITTQQKVYIHKNMYICVLLILHL